jgi:hypothetical protein
MGLPTPSEIGYRRAFKGLHRLIHGGLYVPTLRTRSDCFRHHRLHNIAGSVPVFIEIMIYFLFSHSSKILGWQRGWADAQQ